MKKMKKMIFGLLILFFVSSCTFPLFLSNNNEYARNKQKVRTKIAEQKQYEKYIIHENGGMIRVCNDHSAFTNKQITYLKRLVKDINCLYRYKDFTRTSAWFKTQIGKPIIVNDSISGYDVRNNTFQLSLDIIRNKSIMGLQFKIFLPTYTFCKIDTEQDVGIVLYDHEIYQKTGIELPFHLWMFDCDMVHFEF